MKKSNIAQIIFEIISVIGNVVVGVTILTFIFNGESIDKTFISFVSLSIGAAEIVVFLGLKDSAKLRNIPNLITNLSLMIFGIILFGTNVDLDKTCLIWAIVCLALYTIKIANFAVNFISQPLYNIIKILLSIITIVFSIVMIAERALAMAYCLTYIGVSLLIEAFILLIEFIIHRYQK